MASRYVYMYTTYSTYNADITLLNQHAKSSRHPYSSGIVSCADPGVNREWAE